MLPLGLKETIDLEFVEVFEVSLCLVAYKLKVGVSGIPKLHIDNMFMNF